MLTSEEDKFSAEEVQSFIDFAKDSEMPNTVDWRSYLKAAMSILWKDQ